MLTARAVLIALMLPAATVMTGHAQSVPPPARDYLVIVHPHNPLSSVDRNLLTEIFLKKVSRWPHGEVARPVDLSAGGAGGWVRRNFAKDILQRSVEAVRSYWQQLIFAGRNVPPPELDSNDAVVQYVITHPGAVGYVSGTAEIDGAKILRVR